MQANYISRPKELNFMAKPGKELSFTVLIEQDEDGLYVAKVPDIPGCYTQGRTVEQAMERVKEAIQACLGPEEEARADHVQVTAYD